MFSRRPASLLAALAVIAVAFAGSGLGASAAPTARMAVSPSAIAVTSGEEFTLDYTVADVAELPGIGRYVLALSWDAETLELISLVDAGFVTGGENIVFCGEPTIDNGAGQAVLFCAAIPIFGAPGVSTVEPVVFARSLFRAEDPGTTAIDLSGSYLEGPNEEAIDATISNGSVTVASAHLAPQPTATAQPERTTEPTRAPVPSLEAEATTTDFAEQSPTRTESTFATPQTLVTMTAPVAGSGFRDQDAGTVNRTWLLGLAVAGMSVAAGGVAVYRRRYRRRENSQSEGHR